MMNCGRVAQSWFRAQSQQISICGLCTSYKLEVGGSIPPPSTTKVINMVKAELWYRCNDCNHAWLKGMANCPKCSSWHTHVFFANCRECIHGNAAGDCITEFDNDCTYDDKRFSDEDYFEPRISK